MIGEKFNKLTVVSLKDKIRNPSPNARGFIYIYECLCECGNTSFVRKGNLKSGHTVSCGCFIKEKARKYMESKYQLSGEKFGRLTVLERSWSSEYFVWNCLCDCGEITQASTDYLKAGKKLSCGCFQKEQASERIKGWHRTYRESVGLDPDLPIGTIEDLDRATFKETMQFSILKRDSFSCTWCSSAGVYLQVHHLETWKNSPDKRYDPKNVVTLCTECHKNVHQRDYHKPTDPIMTTLLQGYANIIEEYNTNNLKDVPICLLN